MRENFQNIDGKKLEIVHEIKSAYDEGKISLEEARKALKDRVQHLAPYEIAIIEQEMVEETEDECIKEDIQAMLEVFQDVLVTKDQELPENHPISCYRRENAKMKELLLSVEDLVQYPLIKNQWLELYEDLLKFKIHLSRKQNQLYPVLEKKGFTRPTTTMWTLDDFIRDEISQRRLQLLAQRLGPHPGHVVCQPPQRQRRLGRSGREGRLTRRHDRAFMLESPDVLTWFRPVRHRIGQPCGLRTV